MADPENLPSNKIKHSTSSWSELPIDPCALILSKLSFANVLRFKAVCPTWNKAVKFISQSSLSSSFPCLPEPPWILLPQYTEDDGFRFSSLEGKVYSLKNSPDELRHGNGICLGSSHGWLFFLWNKKQLLPLLLNPVSGIQVPLPRFKTFPDIISIKYKTQSAERELCTIKFKTSTHANNQIQSTESYNVGSAKDLAGRISKVVLCSRPTCSSSKKKIGVLVMYDFTDRWLNLYRNSNYLAICTTTDRRWRKLTKHRMYIDVTSYDNQFYALRQNYYVEFWDFSKSFPIRKMEIRADQRAKIPNDYRDYIIKTGEDVFRIVRLYKDYFSETIGFHIYKLEYSIDGRSRWIEVDSIGKNALFLGLKQSIVMSSAHDGLEWDENSVYFTHMPSYYNNHLGVFNLRNKQVEKVCDLPKGPAPPFFWIDSTTFQRCMLG